MFNLDRFFRIRFLGHRFPNGVDVGSVEISCSVPSPAPDYLSASCETIGRQAVIYYRTEPSSARRLIGMGGWKGDDLTALDTHHA